MIYIYQVKIRSVSKLLLFVLRAGNAIRVSVVECSFKL